MRGQKYLFSLNTGCYVVKHCAKQSFDQQNGKKNFSDRKRIVLFCPTRQGRLIFFMEELITCNAWDLQNSQNIQHFQALAIFAKSVGFDDYLGLLEKN